MKLAAAGALVLTTGLTARADYPSAVLADGPLTYHRFSEMDVTNDMVPVVVNLGTLGAAANGTHVTTCRDDLIQQGLPGALTDPDNTAISVPYSPNTHYNYVRVPWQAGLAYNGPFSFEIWTKPATKYFNYPFGMVNWASPRTGWVFMQSDWDNLVTGHGWVFRIYRNSGTTSSTVACPLVIDTNHWYHLVGVFDGSSVKMYIDGTLAGTATGAVHVPATSGNLCFGVTRDITYGYGGMFDEAAFYTNALTADDVAAHYAAATTNAAGYAAQILAHNPPGYWRFNERFNPSVAKNNGTRGAAADGQYRTYSTTIPELQGPTYPGFETTNTALQVFGTNGVVVVPPLNIATDAVTFECMLKRSGDQKEYAGIAMHGRVTTTTVTPFVAGLNFRGTANNLGYWWYSTNTSASDSFGYQSMLTPPDETWVYAALAVTPTSGTLYMYDGTNWSKEVNSRTHKTAHFIGPTWIGGDRNVANRWFNGCLDEVAIYNKTLTEGQLRSHALAAFGATSAPEFVDPNPVLDPTTVYAGTPFTLSIDGYGPPPVSFQWRQGDGITQTNIAGATGSVYAKASASDADTGYYDVVISSGSSGSVTSTVVSLFVYADYPPNITQDPVSRAVYPGGSVTFGVTADGPALTYQWEHAGTNLPGATASTLTVANVDATKTGDYRVRVTNAAAGQLSAVATLSLLTVDPNSYASVVLADGPEAYWRLDETTAPIIYDSMGRHDGETWRSTPTSDPTGSQWGSAWNQTGALAGDANPALAFGGANFAYIPYSSDLNAPTYTIELWAKPTTLAASTSYYPLVSEDFYSSPTQVAPPCLFDNYRGGYRFWIAGSSTSAGTWWFATGGVTTWDQTISGTPAALNTWIHLVGTFDGWQESLYANGKLIASTIGLGMPNERLGLYIGGDNAAYGFGNPFRGVIDEAAYYKTVLSPERIKLHYELGKYGTNGPVFVAGPASQTVEFGTPAAFTAQVIGATPMNYQWKRNGVDVAGGTDLTLTFASVDYTDAGQYTLAVTNSSNGAVSPAATLVVTPPASVTDLTWRSSSTPAGPKLELIWPMGCALYYTTNLTTGTWLPVSGATAPYYNVPISTAIEQIYYKCVCP